jgi:type IV pilus assembly protein PilC
MGTRGNLARAYQDLATLLDAGIPILRSFDILVEGRQGRFRHILSSVRESLSKGSSLAEAMDPHPRVFPDLDRMLLEAAETSGSLPVSFKMLSHWHEFIQRITRRIWMGLMYPFFILHMGALLFPLPALILSFANGRAEVGAYLRGVIGVLLLLYVPLLTILAVLHFKERAHLLRLALDSLVLRIPLLGRAVYQLSICRYTQAFSMLYKAGVPITECTEKATRATGNMVVARLFEGGTASVRRGGTVSEGFSRRLPAEYLDLWRIGEESGELDKTTAKIAEIAADRADFCFVQFGDWLPKIVYFMILAILAYMVLTLGSQIYGNLPAF